MLLFEDSALKTPEIVGTDEEKISVLAYWSDLVGMLRSINSTVISMENKIAILTHLKNEVELVTLEVTNATAHPVVDDEDGGTSMKQAGDPAADAPGVVDLTKPPAQDQFNRPTTHLEQMRTLAGIKESKKEQPTKKITYPSRFELKPAYTLTPEQYAILAGVKRST